MSDEKKKIKARSVAKRRLRTAGALTAKKAHEAGEHTPLMVERAIGQASRARFNGKQIGKILSREVLEVISRAVIKSMRKPTDEVVQWANMVDIGSVWVAEFNRKGKKEPVTFPLGIALMDTGCREPGKAVLAAWVEMIDAALETKPYHKPRNPKSTP